MLKENLTPIAFQFSATRQDLNGVLIENEPFIIAKDICDILELSNSRKAIASLDEDEKADVTISYTSSNGTVQNRKVKAINESGFYKLIFKSTKPEAKVFQKWVTSEVLPSLRKSGFYGNAKKLTDFIDARDVPYTQVLFNETPVRTITLKEIPYYSLNDYHAAIKSRTESSQAAKKLNKVQPLAVKIWLFGNTHPAWFTTLQGLQLIASGSRVFNSSNQLVLSL
jgi:prophage antirepressor-like protein